MRSASNPGGVGHEWVRARFVDEQMHPRAPLHPRPPRRQPPLRPGTATAQSLAELDPVTRAQLLEGDWQVRPEGVLFKRDWFAIVEQGPESARRVRYWDKAATEGGGARTAGVLIAKTSPRGSTTSRTWSAGSGRRSRASRSCAPRPSATEPTVAIWLEQEPGSGGKE